DCSRLLKSDVVIKSPGIPEDVSIVQMLKGKDIPVISEIEFAGRFSKAFKICVTGSNGKTTTTLLINYILQNAGLDSVAAGNVGKSFAALVAERDPNIAVLEISSFQLDGMFDFKANIAVLTNITPDHLDRYHNDFQHYVDSKFRILQNQISEDHLIYNADDPVIDREIQKRKILARLHPMTLKTKYLKNGAFLNEHNELVINIKNSNINMTLEELALQGKHNTYNSMAGGVAGRLLEIRKETIKRCLSDFQNIEHRLEHVGKVHGVNFINDSKATNINSTWYALESMTGQVIWIAGGIDKGNDYEMLKDLVREKVKSIVCLGLNNDKIIDAFGSEVSDILESSSADHAVNAAYYMSKPGDTVLLSPACASFDLFENFEDRGNQFKRAVRNL
ncbi:MAG: UDP-N-acetylmuramoyl-L-alanine--D-glutamate ligase, partial [Bacteroidales bacterium]|nr:UDP-N-acetylmuramoyl-L-alanine--D-glutamate ligase [Bacteroidales bacterium]